MKLINEVRLEFPSRSANEGFARSAAACFAAQLDPTLEELGDIKTAVSEAVTNAIVHAYPDRMGRITHAPADLSRVSQLEISVRDWGVGIADVEQASDAPVHHRRGGAQRHGLHDHGEFYGQPSR